MGLITTPTLLGRLKDEEMHKVPRRHTPVGKGNMGGGAVAVLVHDVREDFLLS
jgi:hypothetical protein